MEAHIHPDRIDLLGVHLPAEGWEQLLDELKAEYVRSRTAKGKRMWTSVSPTGRIDSFIYRSTRMPDAEIVVILAKHGIPARIAAAPTPD